LKQRITVKHLNELTDEQKGCLREWWKPKTHDIVYDFNLKKEFHVEHDNWLHEGYADYDPKDFLPLLSIGQMIEILQEHDRFVDMTNIEQKMFSPHFCDDLWNEVKRIL
jgi:hypothetical protein